MLPSLPSMPRWRRHTRAGLGGIGGLRRVLRGAGPASASSDAERPTHLLHVRSLGLLCRMKAPHFQALSPARSVLNRELRRKGPVRSEFRRALATSETWTVPVRYYKKY